MASNQAIEPYSSLLAMVATCFLEEMRGNEQVEEFQSDHGLTAFQSPHPTCWKYRQRQ
jgi:hypothetical protein